MRAIIIIFLSISVLSVCISEVRNFGGINFELQAQFVGGPGGEIYGDLFGTPLALNDDEAFVGAQHSQGLFSNGSVKQQAGKLYFFEDSYNWTQSQSTIEGSNSFNLFSGTTLSSDGKWLFVPEVGTPANVFRRKTARGIY
jgi:hypothetical protein